MQVDGVIGYVRDFGRIAEVTPAEIEVIKNSVDNYDDVECVNVRGLHKGDDVALNDGILFDLKGEILEIRGKQVILMMKGLECGLIATIKVTPNALSKPISLSN